MSEDPIGFASKDTNWYRYTWNNPVNLVDHNGLYGTKDCSYYKKVADKTGDFYYKYIGPIACDFFPTQPIFPKWTDCVRLCLQEFDKKHNCSNPCNSTESECIIAAHGYCWSRCSSNPDKDPVK